MRQFIVTDYGAIPNVESVQTDAIQKALDECFLSGGGEVIIPANMSFVTGDIRIRSNTTLHLMETAPLLGRTKIKECLDLHNEPIRPTPCK